jgi:hypothetical protein
MDLPGFRHSPTTKTAVEVKAETPLMVWLPKLNQRHFQACHCEERTTTFLEPLRSTSRTAVLAKLHQGVKSR